MQLFYYYFNILLFISKFSLVIWLFVLCQTERLQCLLADNEKVNLSEIEPIPLPLEPQIRIKGIIPETATLFKVLCVSVHIHYTLTHMYHSPLSTVSLFPRVLWCQLSSSLRQRMGSNILSSLNMEMTWDRTSSSCRSFHSWTRSDLITFYYLKCHQKILFCFQNKHGSEI